MTIGTAFHPRTSQLNGKLAWEDWSGYFAASAHQNPRRSPRAYPKDWSRG